MLQCICGILFPGTPTHHGNLYDSSHYEGHAKVPDSIHNKNRSLQRRVIFTTEAYTTAKCEFVGI